jgi:hypothetical protein
MDLGCECCCGYRTGDAEHSVETRIQGQYAWEGHFDAKHSCSGNLETDPTRGELYYIPSRCS